MRFSFINHTVAGVQVIPSSSSSADAVADDVTRFLALLKKQCEPRLFDEVVELDLSMSQFRAVLALDQSEGELAVHELAEQLGLSVAATGRAVDALTRAGLVSRREDEHDRRIKRVSLSSAGEELALDFVRTYREGIRAFVQTMTEEERQHLASGLAPLLARPEFKEIYEREWR